MVDLKELLPSEGVVIEFTFANDGSCVYRRLPPGVKAGDLIGWKEIGWPLSPSLEQKVGTCQIVCQWMAGLWNRVVHRMKMSGHTFRRERGELTAVTQAMVSGDWSSGMVAAQVDHPDGCVLRFEVVKATD